MNVLSLFDGISVGRQALKDLGIEVTKYFASEIEQDAIEQTKINHPDVIHLGDVTKWYEWELPKIDLIIGGSPCQGFSRQGVGLNFDDSRSKLFFEFRDIVEHHREYNPDVKFMLENVNMKREWEDIITSDMGVHPIKINSDVFLPHNRPRTYWTDLIVSEPDQVDYKMLDFLDVIALTDYEIRDGLFISNEFSGTSKELITVVNGEVRIKQPVKIGYAVANEGDGINISFPTSGTRRGRVVINRSSCLDTACDIGVYDQFGQIRRFTIDELERLQGLPGGYTSNMTPTGSKKALGNGWTNDVIKHIFKSLL